jgi:hypothetical protein
MKTKIFYRLTAVLLGLLFTGNSFAQVVTKIDTLPTVYIFSYSLVNKNVHDAFKKDFKNAVKPRWFTMDQNYLVKFISKDQKNHALYNSKGSIIYHISYGNAQTMPKDIRAMVSSKYPSGDIVTAINVNQNQRKIWIVNVKERGDLVLVRFEDDQLEEVDRVHDSSM